MDYIYDIRNMKTIITILILGFIVLICLVILYLGVSHSTPQFKDTDGNVISGSIAELVKVELGGLDQWILIRGQDTTNPILLWLHGGPGAAQMPLAHAFDNELEKEFIIVHWDQRGAGKSNHRGFDEETMTFDQFINDGYELIQYLRERFERERLFLLGHSWGTQIGIELVNRHPELFHAYIGVSQLVDSREGIEIAYEWLMNEIEINDDQASLEKLNELGTPPYPHRKYREFAGLVDAYGGNFDMSMGKLARIAIRASEYNFRDYIRWIGGANRGGGPMHSDGEMAAVNFRESISSLDVPVYFFTGRNDYNTPLALVEEYKELLHAPEKEIVVFENSAHTPFLGEPEKFRREVVRVKSETYPTARFY